MLLPIPMIHATEPDSDYQKIPWGELEIKHENVKFTKNMFPRSIVQAGEQFFVVQKVDYRDENFAANSTFSAVVGYAFQKGDHMIPFPRGENVTDAEHDKFARDSKEQRDTFFQESEFAKSFELEVNTEKPFLIKSSFMLPEPGKYTHQFFKKLKNSPAISSANMGSTIVVEKFSKAINEDATCQNEDHRILIKHDYSNVACVTGETALKLKERGWANFR